MMYGVFILFSDGKESFHMGLIFRSRIMHYSYLYLYAQNFLFIELYDLRHLRKLLLYESSLNFALSLCLYFLVVNSMDLSKCYEILFMDGSWLTDPAYKFYDCTVLDNI